MMISRRELVKGGLAALGFSALPAAFAKAVRLRHDPDLTALISDCHINGLPNVHEHYQPAELAKWKKPVFVCSHYAAGAVKVRGKRLHELLLASPLTAGYIHGHDHRWRRDMLSHGWTSPRVVKSLCLPSTGHWGDIGWSLMRTGGGRAKVSLYQRDFWFPIKDSPEPGADHEMWRLNTAENTGATCTFTLPDV